MILITWRTSIIHSTSRSCTWGGCELSFILRKRGKARRIWKRCGISRIVRSRDVGTRAHGIAGVIITCRPPGCIDINDKSVTTHAIATVTGDYFFSRRSRPPAGPQLVGREILQTRLEQSDVSWKRRFLRSTKAMLAAPISSALINAQHPARNVMTILHPNYCATK